MILLEKLLLLKTVPIFDYTPNEILMKISDKLCQEVLFHKDDCIIEKGKTDMDIYIIVYGKLEVYDEYHLIKTLEKRDFFGELSAFSQQPRTASVKASTECKLLKINTSGLYDLMEFNVGLAKGIIRALALKSIEMTQQIHNIHFNQKNNLKKPKRSQ